MWGGEPDTVYGQATVQVCHVRCLVDVESFCDPSMGEAWYNFLHFGTLPLHLVSRVPMPFLLFHFFTAALCSVSRFPAYSCPIKVATPYVLYN